MKTQKTQDTALLEDVTPHEYTYSLRHSSRIHLLVVALTAFAVTALGVLAAYTVYWFAKPVPSSDSSQSSVIRSGGEEKNIANRLSD